MPHVVFVLFGPRRYVHWCLCTHSLRKWLCDNTPTVTATSDPTISIEGGANPGSTIHSGGSVSLSTPGSDYEALIIPANRWDIIQLDLNPGDTLTVSYSAVLMTSSGVHLPNHPGPAIEFVILDPLDWPLLKVDALEDSSVEVQVEMNGTHLLVFGNPYSRVVPLVTVGYAINP